MIETRTPGSPPTDLLPAEPPSDQPTGYEIPESAPELGTGLDVIVLSPEE